MTRTTLFSDVVLPAATWYEKHDLSSDGHAPVRPLVQPGDRAAVADPHGLRHRSSRSRSGLAGWRSGTWARARTSSPSPLMHDTPDEMATPHGRVPTRRATTSSPASRCRSSSWSSATTPRSPTAWRRSARSPRRLGHGDQGRDVHARPRGRRARSDNGVVADGPAAVGRASRPRSTCARRSSRCPARRTAGSRCRGSRTSRSVPGTELAWLAREHEGKRITFPDVQARPSRSSRRRSGRARSTAAAGTPLRDQRRAAQALAHPHRAGSTSSSTTTG